MKVLLIQDVDNLGYAGDVKKVANGYGRNYLLPQQLAVLATPGALKQAETIRKAAEKRRAQETADAQAVANQLTGLKLLFERRAGETGKLYGSVTSGDIAEAIHEKTGIELDKRKVAVPEPIRSLGEQEVPIKLMIDVTTSITVEVVPLGGILERERLEEVEAEAAEAETEAEEAIDDVVAAAAEVAESPVEEEDEEPVLESEPEAEEEEEETEA
jgi:large subunit ribosomal protein L9